MQSHFMAPAAATVPFAWLVRFRASMASMSKVGICLLYFPDGLTDCEDPECCENPVCRKSQLCHTVPYPIDILLRKQPPSSTASFFERMKFIIEDKGLQSYVERAGFNERYVNYINIRSADYVSPATSTI